MFLNRDEQGNGVQIMPLVDGMSGTTTADEELNVAPNVIISFETDVTVTELDGNAQSPTFTMYAGKEYGVNNISTLTINTETVYLLV